MPDDMQPDIKVTLTLEVRDPNNYSDEPPVAARTFTAEVNTDGNRFDLARKNAYGLVESASAWLTEQKALR
jgi:hypothetical protein